jgi:hypothetical protein
MKIDEFTNATDILALWKLISDNTWTAKALKVFAISEQCKFVLEN